MKITQNEVKHVAKLARLALTPEELGQFTTQLDAILGAFQKLSEVNTQGIEAQSHAIPIELPLREDEITPSLPREELLQNAPASDQGSFLVQKIVEK